MEITQNFIGKKPLHVKTDDTFEVLLKTYEYTQHWITLADTKAGLALTITGVVTGFMLQQLVLWKKNLAIYTIAPWIIWSIGAFLALYFLFQIISFLYVIQVFFPRTLKKCDYLQTRHVFNVGLVLAFPKLEDREKMWQEYKNLSEEDLKREYVYQLHTDNLICGQKYKSLKNCLKSLLIAVCFAFFTFVLAVFLK